MSRFEIRLAGLGGQGIILAGVILGFSASVYAGKSATQAQSYGAEARGGACKAEVVISDEEIDYPKVEKPDLLVVMSQEAYNKYVDDIKSGGTLVYDSDMVYQTKDLKNLKVYKVPATKIAEKIGRKIVANMVMIGAVSAISKVLDPDSVEKAIARNVPRGTETLNVNAFKEGYSYAANLGKK